MIGACSSCGEDPGFDWAICPSCGNRPGSPPVRPMGDRWDKTIIEPEATPVPKGDRARFAGKSDFYTPVGGYASGGNGAISGYPRPAESSRATDDPISDPAIRRGGGASARGPLPDSTVHDRSSGQYGGDGSDHTIIERGGRRGAEPVDDGTMIIRGGRRGVEGPLVYLVLRNGIRSGKVYLLSEETGIGRGADQDIILGDETVSKRHAKVKHEDGKFIFWDLASTNHSYVLGPGGQRTRIFEPHTLSDGDTIELGDARMTYIEVDAGAQE